MSRTVQLFMQKNPICIDQKKSLSDAIAVIEEKHISQLIVTNNGKLHGIVSKTNLLQKAKSILQHTSGKRMSFLEMQSSAIENFMTHPVISISPNDTIDFAVELLLQKEFHCLPVVDDNNVPVGIVTAFDLLKGYYQEYG